MPHFMLVLRDDPTVFQNYGPADMQSLLQKYESWAAAMTAQGRLVGGNKLQDEGGRTMRVRGGCIATQDGPYAETKEIVSGYFIVRADDYDHAQRLCADHPVFSHQGVLEIRAVDYMGQPEP